MLAAGPGRTASADDFRKRAREKDEEKKDDGETEAKARKVLWRLVVLGPEIEPPYPVDSDSDVSDSIYSIQEKETDWAKSTSDTDTKSESEARKSRSQSEASEYTIDVPSFSEDDDPLGERRAKQDGSTTSGSEDRVGEMVFIDQLIAEDLGLLADSSDCSSSASRTSDSEVPRADYWRCTQCSATQNNPRFRYCEKCFQIRKSYFPPRPRRKEKKKRGVKGETPGPSSSLEMKSSSQNTTSSQETPSSQETNTSSPDAECQICCASRPDGAFAHGKSVHLNYACYKCAKKWHQMHGRCPVCVRTVNKVYKAL